MEPLQPVPDGLKSKAITDGSRIRCDYPNCEKVATLQVDGWYLFCSYPHTYIKAAQ